MRSGKIGWQRFRWRRHTTTKSYNRIRQDLAKDRIVSFEGFGKSRVNGDALRSNGCVGLPTSKEL